MPVPVKIIAIDSSLISTPVDCRIVTASYSFIDADRDTDYLLI